MPELFAGSRIGSGRVTCRRGNRRRCRETSTNSALLRRFQRRDDRDFHPNHFRGFAPDAARANRTTAFNRSDARRTLRGWRSPSRAWRSTSGTTSVSFCRIGSGRKITLSNSTRSICPDIFPRWTLAAGTWDCASRLAGGSRRVVRRDEPRRLRMIDARLHANESLG